MKGKSKLDPYKDEIIKEYLTTIISIRGLGKKYKVDTRTIKRLLKNNNIELIRKPLSERHKKGISDAVKGKSGLDKYITEIISDYIDKEFSMREIGDNYNVAKNTIRRLLKENDIVTRKSHTKRTKKKMSITRRGRNNAFYGKKHTEEAKKKVSKSNKGRACSGETKKKISISKSGENHPMFGKHHSKEAKKRISKANKGENNGRGMLNKHHSEKTKKKLSSLQKELWQNPEYVQKQMKANGVAPNKLELYLQDLLSKWLPKEFKYVGDGEFILAGKCPDFVNINGKKLIIELFGDFWHGFKMTGRTKEEEEQQRTDHFEKYGYQTLIIWESEIKKDLDKTKEKVMKFVK